MRKVYILSLLLFGMFSCSQDLTDLNVDTKNPETVQAGTLFANATVELMDFMASTNVNDNNFRLWAQQWAQTQYPDESNYELVERNVNGRTWNKLYATVIRDLIEVKTLVGETPISPVFSEENQRNQDAMAEVLEIFAWHLLVDIFGDIPYSQAFGDDVTPAYDDDASIYSDLASRLDAAIGKLSGDSGDLGDSDLIYHGDVSKWRKFANSLKLRMAIRMADMNNASARKMAEDAVNDGVFESSDDDFRIYYTSSTPHTNPVWVDIVQSLRNDFVAANTIVDYMNELKDPRLPYYFQNPIEVTDSITGETTTMYVGGVYGTTNSYNAYSQPGALQRNPTLPHAILDFTEVSFLLADAAEREYAVGGTAEDFYKQGIMSSILQWGGTEEEANEYLGQDKVAYATAEGGWKHKIALQKWLALYNRGFEAWTTWRVYDAPELNIAQDVGTLPPTRFTYPVTEFSLNGESVEDAAAAIGGDELTTKVFWDMQ